MLISEKNFGSRQGWEEKDRLAALRSYAILDTAPEIAFDDIARIAAENLLCPNGDCELR